MPLWDKAVAIELAARDDQLARRDRFRARHPEVFFDLQIEGWYARWADEHGNHCLRSAERLRDLLDYLEPKLDKSPAVRGATLLQLWRAAVERPPELTLSARPKRLPFRGSFFCLKRRRTWADE